MALLRHHLTVRLCVFLVFLLVLRCSKVEALDNGVALTPPMGWLQWERFACNTDCANDPDNCISEKLFMQMADCLAADGFKELGYEFVNIDDCWASKERDANGNLQADPNRFPHGIKYLADYVHSKGLKLGIYGDIGTKTCGGFPGTLNYIEKDANIFASWGVDMLKLDGCSASPEIYESGYPNMSTALNATGRHIVYSCSWPAYIKNPNYTKIAKYCNLWRNYDDINDSWQSVLGIIQHYADVQDDIVPFAGPGHWNDPDMIIAGNFGLSYEQQKAQFALWAIFAAPLLMSNDLRNLPDEAKAILQNKEVIAVNQDPLGIQGKLIEFAAFKNSNDMVFSRPLSDKSVAVAMLNTAHFAGAHNITVDFQKAGVSSNTVMVRDLFEQQDLGKFTGKFSAPVNPTGVKFLLLKPASTD